MTQAFFFTDFENSHIPEILKEMYLDRAYDPYLKGENLTILDIGANIGLFSYFAYDKAKIIYALEPSVQHYQNLVTMLVSNEMHNVAPIQKAISDKVGTADFYHSTNDTMFSLKKEVNDTGELERVETTTLDAFFQENNIEHVDFMKIDVEGAEAAIFGSDTFDKVKDKIDIIMGEYHVWTGINPNQFRSYFTDRGFTFKWADKTIASLFIAERIK